MENKKSKDKIEEFNVNQRQALQEIIDNLNGLENIKFFVGYWLDSNEFIVSQDFYIKYTCPYETVERNNYQEVEDISQTPGNTDSALTDNEKDNILEEENYEIYLKDESKLSTRELEYLKLRKLKKSLEEGNIENLEEIKNEYKRINNWYRNITEVYPEIHNLLKEIKKLL